MGEWASGWVGGWVGWVGVRAKREGEVTQGADSAKVDSKAPIEELTHTSILTFQKFKIIAKTFNFYCQVTLSLIKSL